MKVFASLDAAGAFFLSRLRYGVGLYNVHARAPIDLPRRKRGQERLEMDVLLGCKQQFRVLVNTDGLSLPWVPSVMKFLLFGNMGVALLSRTTTSVRTRLSVAKAEGDQKCGKEGPEVPQVRI